MQDFVHVRLIPYAVGALEFLQNLGDNVHDFIVGRKAPEGDAHNFAGKVRLAVDAGFLGCMAMAL